SRCWNRLCAAGRQQLAPFFTAASGAAYKCSARHARLHRSSTAPLPLPLPPAPPPLQRPATAAPPPLATSVDITDMDLASEKSLWALYDRWCEHHNVVRDLGEKARRFSVFEENARMIHQFNQGDAPYKLSLNLFGDMTDEEVDDGYGRCSTPLPNSGKRRQGQVTHGVVAGRANYPMYVDWRMTGYDQRPSAVTNVKIQRGCGSCWAFSIQSGRGSWCHCLRNSS
ncbi:hypothetical protein ZWY2020_015635, partial [Hordeum vulgare]